MIVNVDSDLYGEATGETAGPNRQSVEAMLEAVDSSTTVVRDGHWRTGDTDVFLLRWEAADPPSDLLPDQQCMERLICAAIIAAYPERGPAVLNWLAARPSPPPPDPKAHLWSDMAGWFASHGCEDFIRRVWADTAVAAELEKRLKQSGGWQIAENLAI